MGHAIRHHRSRSRVEAHHHEGMEYIVAGIAVVLLFAVFALLLGVQSGTVVTPMIIGVLFGLIFVGFGLRYWIQH